MQNFDVFGLKGFILFSILLKILRQGVNKFIHLALTIINLEVILGKFLDTTNLSGAQTFDIHKLLEIVVVDKYKNLILKPF